MAVAYDLSTVSQLPLQQLAAWLDEARAAGVAQPDAMTLATASADGAPSARMVLLRGLDDRGAVFYTNAESRKGRELLENPRAALVFHWEPLGRQVRLEGPWSGWTTRSPTPTSRAGRCPAAWARGRPTRAGRSSRARR